jgi:drug/metabolite transporter (DMT)-like permease
LAKILKYRVAAFASCDAQRKVLYLVLDVDGKRGGFGSSFRGVACMILSLFVFMLSEAITKWLTQGYPIGQIVFVRSFFFFVPILATIGIRKEWRSLRIQNWHLQGLRALLFVASTFLIVAAIKLLPLANAVAFIHSAPIMITVLAALLLRERVEVHRWRAVTIGFIGILIMTRPTADAFQLSALIAIGAAAATALRDIVTRKLSRTETTTATLAFSTATLIFAAGLTTPFFWTSLTAFDLVLMAASGVLMGTAHYLLIEAYRWSEAGIVAPFKYTSLVWATLLGYLIWGDLPDRWVIAGAVLIIGSGLYVIYREKVSKGV